MKTTLASETQARDLDDLRKRKAALESGKRAPARAFRLERLPDGTFARTELDPEECRSEAEARCAPTSGK
jgi:hypothetical protein